MPSNSGYSEVQLFRYFLEELDTLQLKSQTGLFEEIRRRRREMKEVWPSSERTQN